MRVKMTKQPPPTPTATALGPCPTITQIVGRSSTGGYMVDIRLLVGWLVLGLTALRDSISVYIGPSPKEREKEERKDR